MRSWYAYYLLLFATREDHDVREKAQGTIDYLLRSAETDIPCKGTELSKFMLSVARRYPRLTQYQLFILLKRESWFPKPAQATEWRVKEGLGRHGLGREVKGPRPGHQRNQYTNKKPEIPKPNVEN